MALKGGRKLLVNGINFHWKLKPHRGDPTRAHFVAQEVKEKPGRPMVAWLLSSGRSVRVTPRIAAELISAALELGWNPSGRTNFELPTHVDVDGLEVYSKAA